MRSGGTILDRAVMLAVLVLFVGVLLTLVVTGHADPGTLALFSSPAVVALVGVVLSARQGVIGKDVKLSVAQTNGLLSGPLTAIHQQLAANTDALEGLASGSPPEQQSRRGD